MWVLRRDCWSAKFLAYKIVDTKICVFKFVKNVASTHSSKMVGTHNLCVLNFVSTKSNLHVL